VTLLAGQILSRDRPTISSSYQNRVDLDVGADVLEMPEDLGRALAGAHDRDATRLCHLGAAQPRADLGAVPDAPRRNDSRWQPRAGAQPEHDTAAPDDLRIAGPGDLHGKVEVRHRPPVHDQMPQVGGDPLKVLMEVGTEREGCLRVDERG
jgi:hypothetical protein